MLLDTFYNFLHLLGYLPKQSLQKNIYVYKMVLLAYKIVLVLIESYKNHRYIENNL